MYKRSQLSWLCSLLTEHIDFCRCFKPSSSYTGQRFHVGNSLLRNATSINIRLHFRRYKITTFTYTIRFSCFHLNRMGSVTGAAPCVRRLWCVALSCIMAVSSTTNFDSIRWSSDRLFTKLLHSIFSFFFNWYIWGRNPRSSRHCGH
jgi:hypothetical protein